ncbi:MAG: putative molybdenum carrier protein [Rhodocyclales bacterium]|nr:putative molybdenum carrier protein [Rhodocyclales bacterium]
MNEKYVVPTGFKVISGGQSGADQAGLDWAIAHDLPHGGWCPKGRRSEDGPIDTRYQLVETPGANYLERTEWNIRDSDVTLIFTLTDKLDGGSKMTVELADKLGKPWRHIHPRVHPKYIASFLAKHNATIVNIAGKRESLAPGIAKWVAGMLDQSIDVVR